jgi:hypothetical protein
MAPDQQAQPQAAAQDPQVSLAQQTGTELPATAPQQLLLPILVYGVVEVRRLRRELEAVDEFMRQAAIREPGKQIALPRVSRLLDALAADNSRNLLRPDHRSELQAFLSQVEESAPTIHISFAGDPSSAFTARLVKWLRGNIHPAILLQTGLQPTIAAGCIVRTANHSFNFSLRERFTEQRSLLLKALDEVAPTAAPAVAAPVAASAPAPAAPQPAAAAPAVPAQPVAAQAPAPQQPQAVTA